ncbi:MAG: hypothetical protein ACRDRU_05320 [Pseudonocardiaceae bacterium]
MISRTISAAGPVAAASRLTRRRVCGHSVIVTRIGWCVLEPLPAHGWLVRLLRPDEDRPVIRVTVDLTDFARPWVRVTGLNVSWRSRVRPVHAKILQRLAGRPEGLIPAELQACLYVRAPRPACLPR